MSLKRRREWKSSNLRPTSDRTLYIEHSDPQIDTISPALRAIAFIHDIVVGDDGVVVTVDPVSSIS